MNCKSCNAPLSIEDEFCPYCGTPNSDAIAHRRDMKRFTGDFLKTRTSVLKTANEKAQKSARITLVCIMLVVLVASFIFTVISFDLSYEIPKWKAARHAEEYCEILDTYEANDEFLAFTAFYEQNYLYGVDEFEQYQHIQSACSYYSSIYYDAVELLCEESWEGQHESSVRSLCDNLKYYYEFTERERYEYLDETGAYDQVHLDAANRVTSKVEGLIQMVISFTDEEMEEFKAASSAGKQVMIERRLADNE